jgi:ankyrin repeat protein
VNGHVEIVRELTHRGADPAARDNYGGTPLHNATLSNELQVRRM